MNIFQKLLLLVKVRKPATELYIAAKDVKTGYKTVKFWVAVLGSLSALVAALTGVIPATVAVIATTVIATLYTIVRGLEKVEQVGVKPILQTTEFWVSVLVALSNMILALQSNGVNAEWFAVAQTVITAALAAAQNLGNQQPTEVAQIIDQEKP